MRFVILAKNHTLYSGIGPVTSHANRWNVVYVIVILHRNYNFISYCYQTRDINMKTRINLRVQKNISLVHI